LPPSRRPEQQERTFEGSMAAFYKIAAASMILEIPLVAAAVYQWTHIPARGDLTLRYVSAGVPAFWAAIIPLILLFVFVTCNGQTVTFTNRSLIYRRGTFTSILNWAESLYIPPESRRWDRQFAVSSKDRIVVIRSLFFPVSFDEMAKDAEQYTTRRESSEYRLN